MHGLIQCLWMSVCPLDMEEMNLSVGTAVSAKLIFGIALGNPGTLQVEAQRSSCTAHTCSHTKK